MVERPLSAPRTRVVSGPARGPDHGTAQRKGKGKKRPQSASTLRPLFADAENVEALQLKARPGSAYKSRPKSATASKRTGGKRPNTACGRPGPEEDQGQGNVVVTLNKVVHGLVKEKRLVEAVALSFKLIDAARDEHGSKSQEFRRCCSLAIQVTVELGDHEDEFGDDNDVRMALDYVDTGVRFVKQVVTEDEEEAEWTDKCADMQTTLYGMAASLCRKLGDKVKAESYANAGLESARQRNSTSHRGNDRFGGIEKYSFRRNALEAESRCHLIMCTIVSSSGDHVRALKHARIAATLLEPILPTSTSLLAMDRMAIKSSGVAFYNVGAELEHLKASGTELFEGDAHGKNAMHKDTTLGHPILWYRKALSLARKYPRVFSTEMTRTFETTAKTCSAKDIAARSTSSTVNRDPPKPLKLNRNTQRKSRSDREPEEAQCVQYINLLLERVKLAGSSLDALLAELGCDDDSASLLHEKPFIQAIAQYVGPHIARDIACNFAPTFEAGDSIDIRAFQIFCLDSLAGSVAPAVAPPMMPGKKGSSRKEAKSEKKRAAAQVSSDRMTPAIELLCKIVRGEEIRAMQVFSALDPAGEMARVDVVQAKDALGRMGIDLFGDQGTRLSAVFEDEPEKKITVLALVQALSAKLASGVTDELECGFSGVRNQSADFATNDESEIIEEKKCDSPLGLEPRLEARRGVRPVGVRPVSPEIATTLSGSKGSPKSRPETSPSAASSPKSVSRRSPRSPSFPAKDDPRDLFQWSEYDPDSVFSEAKLDILDAFDISKMTTAGKRTEKAAKNRLAPIRSSTACWKATKTDRASFPATVHSPKRLTLRKEAKASHARNLQLSFALATNPVPISIAGWRTFQSEVSKNVHYVSPDGKTFLWPPMVRDGELKALLEAPRRRGNSISVQAQTNQQQVAPHESSWSRQLRVLREAAQSSV